MSVLPMPMVSQKTTITSDGLPSENVQLDCVPASIVAAMLCLLGKSGYDQEYNPDRLLNMKYPEGYHGTTAASEFVDACTKLGFKLYPVNGTPDQLVQHAHEYLAKGLPVLFTEPDPYVPASYRWSHVCVFYADKPGQLTALDTWIAKPVTRSDAEWAPLLLFNQIWIVARMEEDMTIDIHNAEVAKHFDELDIHHWRCKETGKIIQYALLDNYKKYGNSSLCGLSFLGLPQSNEVVLGPNKVLQFYQFGCMSWDNGHIYPLDLYAPNSPARDPYIAQLEAKIAQMQAQPIVQPAQPDPRIAQYEQRLAQIDQLAQQITQLSKV